MAEIVGSEKPLGGKPFDENDKLGQEIASLRAEISSLKDRLAERAGNAAAYVQDEASTVAGAIREHPATATTIVTLVGAIGFAIGYLVGVQSTETKSAWYKRYY